MLEDKKDYVFHCVYVWFKGWKKGRDGKLFCFIEEKIGRIENVIYINLLLYPYYITCKR